MIMPPVFLFRHKENNSKEYFSSKPSLNEQEKIKLIYEMINLQNRADEIEKKFIKDPDFIEMKNLLKQASFIANRLDFYKGGDNE